MTPEAEFKSDLLRTLQARGYIHQITHPEELDAAAASGRVTGYIGFDATAPSLHVGSLLQIMMLRRMQQAGHKPIVLMGGGTTKVGDPTDKDQSRPLLTEEKIQANIDSIKSVFARFLTFGDGPTDALLVNNADWLDKLGYVEFLRNYGVHFTINRMLTFDSVRLRLEREQPMTFLEFNYMLKQAYGLTSPLLATASGQKMGKTVSGAVWLNADMLSPYDYWQFWRNTEDGDVGRFLRLFTDLPLDEVARLEALTGAGVNEAKKVLATEATRMLHGAEAAAGAEEAARVAFEAGGLSADMPTLTLKAADLAATSHSALMVAAGFAASNSEARKQIANGGFRINGEKVADPAALVDVGGGEAELRSGKRRVRLVIEP
jgi:tyrosyl-tRNA synthetase